MFARLPFLLLSGLLLVQIQTGSAQGMTIRFLHQVTVTTAFIQLGDVAEITNGSPDMIATYQQVRLAPAPPAGGHYLLEFDAVRNRILALGLSTGELEFCGQSRILVNGPAISDRANETKALNSTSDNSPQQHQVLQAVRIAHQALRHELRKHIDPRELALAEFQIHIQPGYEMAFQGTTYLDWKIAGWSDSLEQPHMLMFTTQGEVKPGLVIQVRCDVKMPLRTAAIKQALPMGHVINSSDLIWSYAKQGDEGIPMEEIIGLETRHPLRAGTPIKKNDLRIKPYVRTRDIVSIHARQNGILVKRTMRALGTGGMGESIDFVTLDGKQRFTARVTGYHEAEITTSNH